MGAWDQLHWLFDTDDGALYCVLIGGLTESGVVAAYEFIRARSCVTPDAMFWHTRLESEQRVADYPDATRLVVRGVAEPFHILAPGLAFEGTVLPDLGVYVWSDEVVLDYRMGTEWGPPQLVALFELLRQLMAVSGGRVGLGRHAFPHVDTLFVSELQSYCVRKAADDKLNAAADLQTM